MRWVILLLLIPVACGDEPDRGFAATGSGARQTPYAAIPPGSVPRGAAARRADITAPGPTITPALIAAGAKAYQSYCAPCHGASGSGDGPVTQKGFPRSPPLAAGADSPEQIVAIIGNGQGSMPALAQVPPRARWAIAQYLTREAGDAD